MAHTLDQMRIIRNNKNKINPFETIGYEFLSTKTPPELARVGAVLQTAMVIRQNDCDGGSVG